MPDYVVIPALLNRRSGPSLDDPVVEVLPRDKMITGSDQGNGWVRTVTSDGTFYAMAQYLRELVVARAEAIGKVSVNAPSGGGYTSAPINFPTGRFQSAPTVLASPTGTIPAATCSVVTSSESESGMLLRLHRVDDGVIRIAWHAVEGAN